MSLNCHSDVSLLQILITIEKTWHKKQLISASIWWRKKKPKKKVSVVQDIPFDVITYFFAAEVFVKGLPLFFYPFLCLLLCIDTFFFTLLPLSCFFFFFCFFSLYVRCIVIEKIFNGNLSTIFYSWVTFYPQVAHKQATIQYHVTLGCILFHVFFLPLFVYTFEYYVLYYMYIFQLVILHPVSQLFDYSDARKLVNWSFGHKSEKKNLFREEVSLALFVCVYVCVWWQKWKFMIILD